MFSSLKKLANLSPKYLYYSAFLPIVSELVVVSLYNIPASHTSTHAVASA